MSDENSLITVSGAPVATALNKAYYIDDPTATGKNRLWRSNSTQRIYWADGRGWCIGDLNGTDDTMVFFYSDGTITDFPNPWNVITWLTTYEAYQSYNPNLEVSSDPEVVTTTETIKDYKYTATTDSVFQVAKTYYIKTDLSSYSYISVSQVVEGKQIPENTYYELVDGSYVITSDGVFLKAKTYYTRTFTNDTTKPYMYIAAVFAGNTIPADTYYEATALITKTVTTTTNNRTGEVKTSSNEVVTSYGTTLDIHERYAVPSMETGKIYRFSFVNDFKSLGYIRPQSADFTDGANDENDSDITRGIFRIDSSTTYYDLITSGIDVYQNLYLPLGISKAVYEEDRTTWMNDDRWFKLVNPMLEAEVYYVPSAIIDGIPDGNITPYDRYHMIIDIGIFSDAQLLTELVTCVNMLFKAHFGIPTMAELASYDKVYLPTSYADWMEKEREHNINDFMTTHAEQYYNTLFKDEYNQLEKENNTLRTKVKTYEELVTTLASN